MTTLNKSVWRGSHCSAITKWPVDETGKNSVTPSMIPSKTTAIHIGIGGRNEKRARMTRTNCCGARKDRVISLTSLSKSFIYRSQQRECLVTRFIYELVPTKKRD